MKKKKIIIAMCIAILFMAVGYAAFSANLKINGMVSISSTWEVVFTKIEEVSKTSGVTINSAPTASGTSATFDLDVYAPGDSITYRITVENKGTINAIISDIKASKTANDAIKFEITGIKKGDKLAGKASTTFNVIISFDDSITEQPDNLNDTLTVDINYVQDTGQTITGEDVVVEAPILLAKKIRKDNTAQPDTNIDFSQISSDTNGKGLYYTSTNTEDNKVTYYFRGAVENNYVSFASNTWRIVRINEDGTVRLIKQDSIGNSVFNTNYSDNAYVGYMYGTAGSTTYAATHANINSSTIKTLLDTWYQNNLINYSPVIVDSGFCGDRSLNTETGIGKTKTKYGAYNRLISNNLPQFKCSQTNDLYTITTSTKGNKALTYPIGLISADEVAYAGGVDFESNENYYLYLEGVAFWTMTPNLYDGYVPNAWGVGTDGSLLDHEEVDSQFIGVRPVINLKSTTEIVDGGDGTSSNPYVIKTS